MKNYSFYQFVMTVRGRHDDKGRLAEEIFDDLAFPKHDDDFNILSDYIETHGDFTLQCLYLMIYMKNIRNG